MYEQDLRQSMFSQNPERSYIDKVMGKTDVEGIRAIVKKPRLSRTDLMELMYMLSGTELKLYNYGEWDRYIMAKFFVWIREFCSLAEGIYDYKDDLKKKNNTCSTCKKTIKSKDTEIKLCSCDTPKPMLILGRRTNQLFENNMRYMEHNIKFLVDLYFNLSRSTLSIGATGFMEVLKNKYEMVYPQGQLATQQVQQTPQPAVKFKWKP